MACFILSRKKRRKFRDKHVYTSYQNGNQVLLILPDGREKLIKHHIYGLNVTFYGKENILKINEPENQIHDISVVFLGNNATAVVKNNVYCQLSSGCEFFIDKSSYVNDGGKFWLCEDGAKIIIGKDCAISWNVEFMGVDHHTILNDKGKVCNYPQTIEIRDHVWIGSGVKISKGVIVAENNIIGMGSIVTKSFLETNCIIAGNPAKIVKKNINWNVDAISKYIAEHPKAK